MANADRWRFGYGSRSGRIAPGFDADLVVLATDPNTDITALAKAAYPIRAGKITFQAR